MRTAVWDSEELRRPPCLRRVAFELFVDEISDFRRDLVPDNLLFQDLTNGLVEFKASKATLARFDMRFEFTHILLGKFLVEVFV